MCRLAWLVKLLQEVIIAKAITYCFGNPACTGRELPRVGHYINGWVIAASSNLIQIHKAPKMLICQGLIFRIISSLLTLVIANKLNFSEFVSGSNTLREVKRILKKSVTTSRMK